MEPTSHNNTEVYPSIGQGLLIVGIVLLMMDATSRLLFLESWIGTEAANLVLYVMGMGSSFYIVDGLRRRRVGSVTYDFRPGSWRTVLALALGSVALLVGVSPIADMIPMSETMKEIMDTEAGETSFATFLAVVIAAPVFEELIFRGIVLDGLLRRYSPMTAILVSSFLFGLVHFNLVQCVTGFAVGCFAGWVYLRTRSVGGCIVIHMAANFSGYLVRVFVDFPEGSLEGSDGGWDVLAVTAVSLAVAVFLAAVYFLRAEFNHQPVQQTIGPVGEIEG